MKHVDVYLERHTGTNLLPAYLGIYGRARRARMGKLFYEAPNDAANRQFTEDEIADFRHSFDTKQFDIQTVVSVNQLKYADEKSDAERRRLGQRTRFALAAATGIKMLPADASDDHLYIYVDILNRCGWGRPTQQQLLAAFAESKAAISIVRDPAVLQQGLDEAYQHIVDGTFQAAAIAQQDKRMASDHLVARSIVDRMDEDESATLLYGRSHGDLNRAGSDSIPLALMKLGCSVTVYEIDHTTGALNEVFCSLLHRCNPKREPAKPMGDRPR